jgi:hypothetical protein
LSWGLVVALTGGFHTRILGVVVQSRDPFRSVVAGVVLLLIQVLIYRPQTTRDLERLPARVRARARPIAALMAGAVLIHGVTLGSFAAGASDPYAYVSQAYLWASGSLPRPIPLTIDLPFQLSAPMQIPLGYTVGPEPQTMVPICAPGLPLIMAAALIVGPCGPFLVIPLCGMLFVWCTYRLGARAGGPTTGAVAAIVAATSPVVLHQNLLPMSDVPAAASWTAALMLSFGPRWRDTAAAGVFAAVGLLIRPNLPPLAAVLLLEVVLANRGRQWWRRGVVFGTPLVVVAVGIALLNTYWYGAPSNSGYGAASELYGWENVWPNMKLYGSWLLQSESPGVFVALIPLSVTLARGIDRAVIRGCVLMSVASFACYVSYYQFDVWWYLRFLLPAGGAFAVLIAAGFTAIARVMRRPYGYAAVAAGLAVFVHTRLAFAEAREIFGSIKHVERRYIDIGEYVLQSLPENAAIFSMQHSGGLRFYGGRLTLRYDWVQKAWAEDVVAAVERAGFHPYLIIDSWETPLVVQQWGLPPRRPLPWPIIAQMTLHEITVYDLATHPEPTAPVRVEAGRGRWCAAMHPLRR